MQVVIALVLVVIAFNLVGISASLRRLAAHHEKWPAPDAESESEDWLDDDGLRPIP